MKTGDLITSAISNTFRSKTRTILTILAIFVGAFTLTVTNGLGTGINQYIDNTVSSIGASDVMTVTKTAEGATGIGSGPKEYDPDAISSGANRPGGGGTVTALTDADISTLQGVDGVLRVEPSKLITVNYIQYSDGTKWVTSVGTLIPGQTLQLAVGTAPDNDATDLQVAIPDSLVEPLGFASAGDAIGATVTLAVTDAVRTQHTVEATITGVSEQTLVGGGSSTTQS